MGTSLLLGLAIVLKKFKNKANQYIHTDPYQDNMLIEYCQIHLGFKQNRFSLEVQ